MTSSDAKILANTLEIAALIDNLKAIAQAAKSSPVEIFLSDIHAEYDEAARLINGAGVHIEHLIDELFADTLSKKERMALANLVYFPQEILTYLEQQEDKECGVRHIDEQAKKELCSLAKEVQENAVSKLYVLGDIYDRGPSPDKVMDLLGRHHNAEIIWGNHDVVWMGAAAGNLACIATVIRICARYGNLSVLEKNYGIDLSELRNFALRVYGDDPCVAFGLKGNPMLLEQELIAQSKIQKAIAIMQFKVEAALIDDNPEFGLENRKMLDKIDYCAGTIELDGKLYELSDVQFPGLDLDNPFALTPEEQNLLQNLQQQFLGCEKLQEHVRILLERGCLYKVYDNLLLFHACVPLQENGQLKSVKLFGKSYEGKALFDIVDFYVRQAFEAKSDAERKKGSDLLWYLWLGEGSPLFAKSKMATFELYYLSAFKELCKEKKNAFYTLYEDKQVLANIFEDFGMDASKSRIICGHVPVKVKDGEHPIKAGGHLLCIDGGMSKPYREKTGVAGFCLERVKVGSAGEAGTAGLAGELGGAAGAGQAVGASATGATTATTATTATGAKLTLITPTEFDSIYECVRHNACLEYKEEPLPKL